MNMVNGMEKLGDGAGDCGPHTIELAANIFYETDGCDVVAKKIKGMPAHIHQIGGMILPMVYKKVHADLFQRWVTEMQAEPVKGVVDAAAARTTRKIERFRKLTISTSVQEEYMSHYAVSLTTPKAPEAPPVPVGNKKKYPRACMMWRQFYGRPVSSACVKRLFSGVGKMHCKDAQTMKAETIQQTLMCAVNYNPWQLSVPEVEAKDKAEANDAAEA
eukprot:gene25839-31618_t